MMNDLLDFLLDYVSCLHGIASSSEAYRDLGCWQDFAAKQWRVLCPQANSVLQLTGDFRLRDHIPTTSVGRLDGWVLVASNPGWSENSNAAENRFRTTSAFQDAIFTRHFFDVYPQVTGTTNRTWSRLLRLKAQEMSRPAGQDLRGKRLWSQASTEDWNVGGIDLIPFHSKRDGITPLLLDAQVLNGQRGAVVTALREVALATLKMAIRLRPSRLLVASAAGRELLDDLVEIEGLGAVESQKFAADDSGFWFDVTRHTFVRQQCHVLAFSRQVFSGNSQIPKGRKLQEVGAFLGGSL